MNNIKKGKIIVVEPGSSAMYIAGAIKKLGYTPVILCSIKEYSGDQKNFLEKNGYYEVDAKEASNIVNCIAEKNITNICGMISTADRFIIPACSAAEKLGIRGMDKALLKLNDKAEVINLIKEYSPASIIFKAADIPYDKLNKMLEKSGEIMLKPSKAAGGKGLFELKNLEDIQNLDMLLKREQKINLFNQDLIAQSKIDGTLYSLEGFVVNGDINYIGLSRRTRIGNTETRNEFPIESEVSLKKCSGMTKIIEVLVNKSGYKNGYFHAEMISNSDNTLLIDANFGRVAGGGIALQIAHSNSITIEELYAHVIDVTLLDNQTYSRSFFDRDKSRTMVIHYNSECSAEFKQINIANTLKCQHIQVADRGKMLQPAGNNNGSWVGILVGNIDDVLSDIQNISIVTDRGVLKPVF